VNANDVMEFFKLWEKFEKRTYGWRLKTYPASPSWKYQQKSHDISE
jgi:hypothetical protein